MSRIINPNYLLALIFSCIALTDIPLTNHAEAAYTLDRWYRMGDDVAEGADEGEPVGRDSGFNSTFDSIGSPGSGDLQDLTPFGTTDLPVYVDVSTSRPVPGDTGNSLAIQLDGTDDYLQGLNLNDPSVVPAGAPAGYPTYATQDRGMQMWIQPTGEVAGRTVIDDADEHGLNVTGAGNWQPEIRDNTQNSGVPTEVGQWHHFMQVHDSVGLQSAATYINGIAVASQDLNYNANTDIALIVGADAEEDPDTSETQDPDAQDPPTFFAGIVDELQLFVIDDGSTYGAFSYTEDNGYFTDVFLPSRSGYSFSRDAMTGHNLNAWVEGDIDFDGDFDSDDIDLFKDGWLFEADPISGNGPRVGDYTTLAMGDLDLDGDTDLGDWILLRQYSAAALLTIPSFSELGTSVPEPGTIVIAATAIAIAVLSRQPS